MGNKTSACLSLILGVGLLVGAWYFLCDTRQLLSTAEKAPGVVVGFERRSSKGGSTDYPVIEFTTASGERHRFTTSGPGGYAQGAKIEALYEGTNPAHARVNEFFELWLNSLALGAFGILCLGVGLGTLCIERRKRR